MTLNTPNNRHPIKHPDQRVGVFIDVQNMYYSAKNLHGKKVNFGNIVKEAVAGRRLIRAIAYVVRTESKEEQPFFEALYNLGIETREKNLKIYASGAWRRVWTRSSLSRVTAIMCHWSSICRKAPAKWWRWRPLARRPRMSFLTKPIVFWI